MLLYPKINVYEFDLSDIYSEEQRNRLYRYMCNEHISSLHTDPKYKTQWYTFKLNEYSDEFDKLYSCFLEKCIETFGDIEIEKTNSRSCWAQVSNKELNQHIGRHNHIHTSVINSVYYFSVPDKNTGHVIFYDGDDEVYYQPVEGTLLVFPNHLDHRALHCDSNDYRIAINMEIKCRNNIWIK